MTAMPPTPRSLRAALERTAGTPGHERYILRLYITGLTARSSRAVDNLRAICDEYLDGRYDLEVIDIYQQPGMAKDQQIIAAPTLVKELPLPLKKFIGDMSNTDKILVGLSVKLKEQS
jgi:circadian clock protein KaiB